jgi:hypothetical protein
MSIIDLLYNLLKEKIPGIHATRLQALMAAVQAGLKGAPDRLRSSGGRFPDLPISNTKSSVWIAQIPRLNFYLPFLV